jgi:hypothetical protein
MTRFVWRALLATAILLAATAPGAAASSIAIEGHFTQTFGGRNGELAPCPNGELICGAGLVGGYGRATDAFIIGPSDEFLHAFTLADGSTLTTQLEFAEDFVPGGSGDAPGTAVSFGNPTTLVFDAVVTDATGVFAGAVGSGTVTLVIAGNVQQITVSLDIELP